MLRGKVHAVLPRMPDGQQEIELELKEALATARRSVGQGFTCLLPPQCGLAAGAGRGTILSVFERDGRTYALARMNGGIRWMPDGLIDWNQIDQEMAP